MYRTCQITNINLCSSIAHAICSWVTREVTGLVRRTLASLSACHRQRAPASKCPHPGAQSHRPSMPHGLASTADNRFKGTPSSARASC